MWKQKWLKKEREKRISWKKIFSMFYLGFFVNWNIKTKIGWWNDDDIYYTLITECFSGLWHGNKGDQLFLDFWEPHNSVVMTVFNCGILDFSFSFFVVMASVDTSQGEICSRSLELLLVFLALLIRFWLFTVLTTAMGNFDLLLLFVTEDNERVTGWLDAKEVSCN